MASIIEVKNLTKKYGEFIAVDHVNYTVENGEIFGLIGHNGAGKRRLSMLIGLIPPTEGSDSRGETYSRIAPGPEERRITP